MKWLWGLFKLIPGVPSALTFLQVFKGPCAILALVALLLGGAGGGWAGHKMTRAYDKGVIAEAKQGAAEARKDLADFKTEITQARIDDKTRTDNIMRKAKEVHDEQMAAITGLSGELQRLAAGVRVCTSQSTMRLSQPADGPPGPVENRKSRPAEDVLVELATEFARRADTNAAKYNSLMDRWEKVAREGSTAK